MGDSRHVFTHTPSLGEFKKAQGHHVFERKPMLDHLMTDANNEEVEENKTRISEIKHHSSTNHLSQQTEDQSQTVHHVAFDRHIPQVNGLNFQTLHKHKPRKRKKKDQKHEMQTILFDISNELREVDDGNLEPEAVKMSKFVKMRHPKMSQRKNYDEFPSFSTKQKNIQTLWTLPDKHMPSTDRVMEERLDPDNGIDLTDKDRVGSTHYLFADRVSSDTTNFTNGTQNESLVNQANVTIEKNQTNATGWSNISMAMISKYLLDYNL